MPGIASFIKCQTYFQNGGDCCLEHLSNGICGQNNLATAMHMTAQSQAANQASTQGNEYAIHSYTQNVVAYTYWYGHIEECILYRFRNLPEQNSFFNQLCILQSQWNMLIVANQSWFNSMRKCVYRPTTCVLQEPQMIVKEISARYVKMQSQ